MNEANRPYPSAIDGSWLEHIVSLLTRYPDINRDEANEIVGYLRKGPVLDRGILTGLEPTRDKLAQFRHAHRRELGLQTIDYMVAMAIIVAVILVSTILWNAEVTSAGVRPAA